MKSYIYTLGRIDKKYVPVNVFRVRNNTPVLVGNFTISQSSFKGYATEVMNYLAEIKEIPPRYKEGYYSVRENSNFKVTGI